MNLTVVNNLLDPISVNSIAVALIGTGADPLNQSQSSAGSLTTFIRKHSRERKLSRDSTFSGRSRHSSTSSMAEADIYGPDSVPPSAAPAELEMSAQYERTVNQTVVATSVICKTPLKRLNSGQELLKDLKEVLKVEYRKTLNHGHIELIPGENTITLQGQVRLLKYNRIREIRS